MCTCSINQSVTREEVSLEAPLGHSVVRLELDPHVIVKGGDDVGSLCSTELSMKLWVWAQPAAHFHVVILAHLIWDTQKHSLLVRTKHNHFVCKWRKNPHRCLRSQTHQTQGWYDTGRGPPAATHSSCWVGTLWASPGWWGNHSDWWWHRRRQLLVGDKIEDFKRKVHTSLNYFHSSVNLWTNN